MQRFLVVSHGGDGHRVIAITFQQRRVGAGGEQAHSVALAREGSDVQRRAAVGPAGVEAGAGRLELAYCRRVSAPGSRVQPGVTAGLGSGGATCATTGSGATSPPASVTSAGAKRTCSFRRAPGQNRCWSSRSLLERDTSHR